MADGEAGGAAGEAPVGEQGAGFAQAFGFQVAGGIEHFLHTGAALGPFVADDYDITGHDLLVQNGGHGIVLAFKYAGAAAELKNAVVYAGGFHHAAALGDIAKQHCEAAVLRVGMGAVADAALLAVGIEAWPLAALREGFGGAHAARCGQKTLVGGAVGRVGDVPLCQGVFQAACMNGGHVSV